MKISLTFDTDWVHECAVEYVLELLDKYKILGTFFSTNAYGCLQDERLIHEVGIHPNFNPLLSGAKGTVSDMIDPLLDLYPNSMGFRSHSLTQSSSILDYCFKKGLKYDSNQFHPFGAAPYKDYSGLVRFTHNYVDFGHLIEETDLVLANVRLASENHNILDFHPIHIYLNSPSLEYYQINKSSTNSKKGLDSIRNKKSRGVEDLFLEILKFMSKSRIQGNRVCDLL